MKSHEIKFGRKGRSIVYEDMSGCIQFGYDVMPKDNKFLVTVYRAPKSIITSEQARLDSAYKEVQEFLVSRGYLINENGASKH